MILTNNIFPTKRNNNADRPKKDDDANVAILESTRRLYVVPEKKETLVLS